MQSSTPMSERAIGAIADRFLISALFRVAGMWIAAQMRACALILAVAIAGAVGIDSAAPASAASEPHVVSAVIGSGDPATHDVVRRTSIFGVREPLIACEVSIDRVAPDVTLRGVFVAADVGNVAAPNTVVDQATRAATGKDFKFYVSAPTKGWPVGKYRLDIYVGKTLAKSVPFTIAAR